ncbi:uncharacterized protein RJT20DRAFT_125535 [Scheffersomyces xylosifermentans]|uniref:uncharacterized protein n=1 Tax=Scheffersomyces xylosifermentans TaxID=1304137 RepID=UPI00315D23BD
MLARSGLGLLRKPATGAMFGASRLAVSRMIVARSVSTVKASHEQEQEILIAQRKNRPQSPHLTIYKPQLTAILSTFHRLTGVAMAGSFYALTCGLAASSILGLPFDGASLVSAFAALPVAIKVFAKALMAYPFAYHFANGIRHLVWDFGKELTIPGVYRTGYIVLGFTAAVGSYLAFF